jgi:hypothetical protein
METDKERSDRQKDRRQQRGQESETGLSSLAGSVAEVVELTGA